MSARDELRKYVHLLGDSWTPRSTTDERVERLYAIVAAEVLGEERARADRLEVELTQVRVALRTTAGHVSELEDEVKRLREFERRVTEELEEFEDAAKSDPNTPRVARLMIAALRHAVRGS